MIRDPTFIDGQRIAELAPDIAHMLAANPVGVELVEAKTPDTVITDTGHERRLAAKLADASRCIGRRATKARGEG